MNEYFQTGAVPAPSSPGASSVMRQEFANVAAGFDKLPVMAGHGNEIVIINVTGDALEGAGLLISDFVTDTGAFTLTNKTLSWADNTWVGFGSAATKTAGLLAGNVLLLSENNKLPAVDAGNLTNIPGLSLKADANNATLTGAPVCPTPTVGDSSARIANTQFVTETVQAIGAFSPSNATPLINGVASPGSSPLGARGDHVHPTDTTRAPIAASTASGTSFTPAGTLSATDVQAALVELDTEKATIASPAFTGNPTAPTPATNDNDTSIATTAFVQTLVAQQPFGMLPSNGTPLMNGAAACGVGVEGSRYDHVHPVDTSRAPTSAATATGTSFTPAGTIAATTVQAAIVELDTEKAPLASGVPAGTIIDFAGASIPTGYLRCDGAAVLRATYAALFAAIGTEWGAGDGTTTFNLPNFTEGEAAVATTSAGFLGDATNGEVIDHTHPLGGTLANLSVGGSSWGNNTPLNSGTATNTGGVSGAPTKNLAAGRKVFKLIKV